MAKLQSQPSVNFGFPESKNRDLGAKGRAQKSAVSALLHCRRSGFEKTYIAKCDPCAPSRQTPYPMYHHSSPIYLHFSLYHSTQIPIPHRPFMFVCLFYLEATPKGVQRLFLAPNSEITAGRFSGPSGILRIKLGSATSEANTLPTVLSLQPLFSFHILHPL